MKKRELRLGFDFDGVIAYSPTRLIRAPISWIKRNVLKKGGVSFFVPKYNWQVVIWTLIFNSSILPEKGLPQLKTWQKLKNVKCHLITGRFDFLGNSMNRWLEKQNMEGFFVSVNINLLREQPHRFKERMINKLKLNYFIDDNLDTVLYLAEKCKNTKILWIYNLVDKRHNYPFKFSDLENTLEYVKQENSI